MAKAKRNKSGKQRNAPVVAHKEEILAPPDVGNYMTIAAAIVFQFVLILLPLVGPAGSIAPHAAKNFVSFLLVLLLAIVLSGLAVYSKLKRRQQDGSPLPYWSMALCGASLFLLFALFAGLLRI